MHAEVASDCRLSRDDLFAGEQAEDKAEDAQIASNVGRPPPSPEWNGKFPHYVLFKVNQSGKRPGTVRHCMLRHFNLTQGRLTYPSSFLVTS
jgi:hypothetical protein